MQWVRSILGSFGRARRLVGTDLQGNQYFETIREGRKPKREMLTNMKPEEYTTNLIPIEWEAWIRGKREDPPTHEELLAEQNRVKTLQERVMQLEEKDREQQALEGAPPQIAAQVGHAAAPLYESLDNRDQPTSTGTTFQPGEWAPGTIPKGKDADEETFEPDAWVPPGNQPSQK